MGFLQDQLTVMKIRLQDPWHEKARNRDVTFYKRYLQAFAVSQWEVSTASVWRIPMAAWTALGLGCFGMAKLSH